MGAVGTNNPIIAAPTYRIATLGSPELAIIWNRKNSRNDDSPSRTRTRMKIGFRPNLSVIGAHTNWPIVHVIRRMDVENDPSFNEKPTCTAEETK